jgi:hypothetical protein
VKNCLWCAAVVTAALIATDRASGQRVTQPPVRIDADRCGPIPTGRLITYSLEGDSAAFVVTQFGDVLMRPALTIDENDRVTIHVITTNAVAPFLRVKRTSPMRSVGTINIAGEGVASIVSSPDSLRGLSSKCDLKVQLADFAGGRGEVEIALVKSDGKTVEELTQGAFDFAVNPLYSGAFSLGPLQTTVADPTFAIVKKGTDSVITQAATGKRRVLYALVYTPFIWGRRDLEKPAKHLWERLNPSLGAPLQDIGSNALVGLTIDLPFGVFLNYGVHGAKVSELDPIAGAALGQSYAGSAAPTRKRWTFKPYAGVTVDLRAALKLIHTAGATTLQ